jgi:hypothetical protein
MNKGILIAVILSIITPLILSFIFLTLLSPINWTLLEGGFPQILAILSFSSIAFSYNVPLFGYSYCIPLFMWILTGLLVGLCCKSVKRGVLITILGLLIQILLFILLTTMNPSFIPSFLITPENMALLGGFSLNFLLTLGIFLCWWAFTLPGSIIGGIMGGLVSRSSISE